MTVLINAPQSATPEEQLLLQSQGMIANIHHSSLRKTRF